MKLPNSVGPEPPPPRLSMSEYADWIEYMISIADPESVRRQKEFEEQIETPFRIAHAGVTAPGYSVGEIQWKPPVAGRDEAGTVK